VGPGLPSLAGRGQSPAFQKAGILKAEELNHFPFPQWEMGRIAFRQSDTRSGTSTMRVNITQTQKSRDSRNKSPTITQITRTM